MFRAIEIDELQSYSFEYLDPASPRSIYAMKLRNSTPNFLVHPRFIYLYYIKFVGAQPFIRRYEHEAPVPININAVEPVIVDLVRKARNGLIQPLPDLGISGSIWTRKSYIVIVMDDAFWKLHKFGPQNRAAVIFDSTLGTPNHSFFDGKDMDIDMVGNGNESRSAVYFVNHMKKNDAGEDITVDANNQPDSQDFKFDILYDVTQIGGPVSVVRDDPTGTNLGPPQ